MAISTNGVTFQRERIYTGQTLEFEITDRSSNHSLPAYPNINSMSIYNFHRYSPVNRTIQ